MPYIKTLTINGDSYTIRDGEAAHIDDTSVGTDAWSSKHAVDKMCPAFTERGAVASCEPVEGYPLKVVSRIDPVQAGSGDPTPDNIRPITGHTAVTVQHMGKNLMDMSNVFLYGKTNIAGIVHRLKAGQTYTVTLYNITNTFSLWLSEDRGVGYKALNITLTNGVPKTFTAPAWIEDRQHLVLVGVGNTNAGEEDIEALYGQIELGSVATEYEPYQENAVTADFGQTVFGGSYDWNTGVLTVDHILVELDENSNIVPLNAYYQISGYPPTASGTYPNQARETQKCNCASIANVYNETDFGEYMAWVYTTAAVNEGVIRISAPVYEAIKAGAKFQITYKLAEPDTIRLSPRQFSAHSGVNNFCSDTGATTVTGKANPTAVIERLTNAIVALGGNV